MYQMYAMDAPKAPKPLVKLPSKEGKSKPTSKPKPSNESTSTLGTTSSFGSHRSTKGKGTGTGLPSIIPGKFSFKRTNSIGRMPSQPPEAPTPTQNSPHSDAQPSPQNSGTPISPAFPVQSEEEIRKKRIERVERTFGEHVPTELVFPNDHEEKLYRELDIHADDLERIYASKQESKAVRRASISVATFTNLRKRAASSIASTHSRNSSGTSDSHEFVSNPTVRNPNPRFDITEERRGPAVPQKTADNTASTRNIVPRPLPPTPAGASQITMGPRGSKEHAETHQESTRTESKRLQPRQSSLINRTKSLSHPLSPFAMDASLPRPSSPFVDNLVPIPGSKSGNGLLAPPGMELVGGPEGTVVRRERKQGWSGEWNRDDMQDVIQKLRALK